MAASLFGVSTSSLRLDFSIASYSSSSSSSACRRPRRTGARCSLMSSSERERESLGKDRTAEMEFKMSDFAVSNHVSTGLQGRADEVIFEATVKNSESPLYNSRVVLRELTSVQAQRRGRRALEVLKKLERRQLMYHSYAMQVHGYVSASSNGESRSFMLVHGYHGSYSLRHWLQLSDWLPTLEATLALDDEWARRVGDGTIGGPAVTRQLRLTRILMRDLLIGVNYLHSHGLAHTELRLENVHISPVDKHVKVGILGNAVDLYGSSARGSTVDGNTVRKTLMIAFDMRCVGFIMAKMVLRELMDTAEFMKFKSFLTKGNDPSCLREFLLPILSRQSPSGNAGLQMLDRNWGAGWNLLCLLLATKPSERISCLDALRHPFLCGPKWRVDSSMNIIRWGLGSTTVRMAEDYIYGRQQRTRISYFIELMELLNPNPRRKNWLDFLPGKWRILYSTGRHIGLTLRQPSLRVLILSAHLTFIPSLNSSTPTTFSLVSHITFTVMPLSNWPHNKSGIHGTLHITTLVRVAPGRRLYLQDSNNESIAWKVSSQKLKEKAGGTMKEPPFGLPALKFVGGEVDVEMTLDPPSSDLDEAGRILKEVRTQIPPEMFDVVKIVCGTYIDSRLMVLRGVNGSALLFTRSCS